MPRLPIDAVLDRDELRFSDVAAFAAAMSKALREDGWGDIDADLFREIGTAQGPTLLGEDAYCLSEALRKALTSWREGR